MAKDETCKTYFRYKMGHKDFNYSVKDWWQPGDSLTEADERLLANVKRFYEQRGYPPCRADLPLELVSRLKSRFRTWGNVILAAGLSALNSPEIQREKQGMQLAQGKE